MAREKPTPTRQRRTVYMSISAPVSARFTVERKIDEDGNPDEWFVVGVRNASCDLTPTGAMECMTDDDRDELDRQADAAEDEPC